MDKAKIYQIYELGANLRPLKDLPNDTTVNTIFIPLANARSELTGLLGDAAPAKIDLCRAAVQELHNAVEAVHKRYFLDEEGNFRFPQNSNEIVTQWYVWRIREAAQKFEAVFQAEMQAASAYWVPQKGTYSTPALVDHADAGFPKEMRGVIGDQALEEYKNAGKCFAFGLYSASGYHACRAVESVLRAYYLKYIGSQPTEGSTWGDMLKDLLGADPKPNKKTLGHLKLVKDHDRNPLMHVRSVLDEQDADTLLKSTSIVIALMAKELTGSITALPAPIPALVQD